MPNTTIKLDTAVRDRLAARAKAHGRTLGEEIVELQAAADREEFWRDVADGYRRLRAEPAAWRGYWEELHQWERLDLAPLEATAAEEYPEYNSSLESRDEATE